MARRIDDLTPLHIMHKRLAPRDYHEVRLALLRHGTPLRLQLKDPNYLGCILDHDVWLCVDLRRDEWPLLAWTGFQTHGRALHEPVSCELHCYHVQAGLIMGRALEGLLKTLKQSGSRAPGATLTDLKEWRRRHRIGAGKPGERG